MKKTFILEFIRTHSILILIFCIALVLRLYHLGSLPLGLHEDEMMNGYVGRFILLNGRDLYGNRWPLLYFNNFGDYPPVIPMYISGLSTMLFGINEFAVRLPIALAGSIAVIPMYALLRQVFVKKRYAYAGAFFLAILPWHIMLSRATAENITAGAVHLLSLLALFQFLRSKKYRDLFLLVLLLFSKYFLYASFRVTIPLSLFVAVFFTNNAFVRKCLISIAILFTLVTLTIGKTPWGEGRFKQTSIFYFNNTIAGRITKLGIEEGENNILLTRTFHNKAVAYTREFIRQYFSYFSPSFLFSDGGLPHRYLMSDTGALYISFAGFVVLAFLTMLLDLKLPDSKLWTTDGKHLFTYLFIGLLIAPIPSALTLDDVPNLHRAATVALMMIFPITYFFAQLEKLSWKKISVQSLLIMCIGIEFIYFWHQFSVHVPHIQSTFRGDDRTTLAKYLVEHHGEFDHIYLPHDAKPLYYLFYSKNFSASLAGAFGPNITLASVDNLTFTGTNCPSETKEIPFTQRTLFIDRGECVQLDGFTTLDQVKRYDGSGSFRLQKKQVSEKQTKEDSSEHILSNRKRKKLQT